jgi:hypothetical protein
VELRSVALVPLTSLILAEMNAGERSQPSVVLCTGVRPVSTRGARYSGPMDIEITDDARRVLEKKGGTMSIDLIRPTG